MSNTQPSIDRYINNLMHDYNENMQEYSRNVQLALQIFGQSQYRTTSSHFADGMNRSRNIYTTADVNNNWTNAIFSNILNQYLRRGQGNAHFLDSVIVRPTQTQIENATECFIFNSDTTQVDTLCPITLEAFTNGEEICRIRHCRHSFKKNALMNWFERNVRCPVCRFDIRDEPLRQEQEQEQEQPEQPELLQTRRAPTVRSNSGLLQNISSALRTFINSEIGAGTFGDRDEITFSFDIPPLESYMDLSYNRVD